MKITEKIKNLSKTQRKIFYVILIFIILDLLLAFSLMTVNIVKNNQSNVVLEFSDSNYNLKKNKVVPLNSNAKKRFSSNGKYAFYKFSDLQKAQIEKFYNDNKNASLVLRVEINTSKNEIEFTEQNKNLNIGFLTDKDFNEKGKFQFSNERRVVVQLDVSEIAANKKVDVAYAMKKAETTNEQNIPCGFFIQSFSKCNVISSCIAPCIIGFDKNTEVPFYGVSNNGGKIDSSFLSIDYSGASLSFSSEHNSINEIPSIEFSLSQKEEDLSTLENPKYVELVIGGEKVRIKNVKGKNDFVIPTAALKNPFSQISISSGLELINSIELKTIYKQSDNIEEQSEPIELDPGLIIKYDQSKWRNQNYELFKWDRFDGILFFDMKNFAIQDRYFSRLAFFIEKEGFKGRLLTNEELNGKHGYNAHDYSAESLAYFFNTAYDEGFTLNVEEENLKRILLYNKLLLPDGKRVKSGVGGIVSISRESPEWSRIRFLAHEGWHTLYFTKGEFRNYVAAVYYTIDPSSLQFIKDYFASQSTLGYDTNDNYLMQNEFMAYIMQQPISGVAQNFLNYASWESVNKYTPELCSYIKATNARAFEDAAIMMTDFVFDNYGIVAGDISLINR